MISFPSENFFFITNNSRQLLNYVMILFYLILEFKLHSISMFETLNKTPKLNEWKECEVRLSMVILNQLTTWNVNMEMVQWWPLDQLDIRVLVNSLTHWTMTLWKTGQMTWTFSINSNHYGLKSETMSINLFASDVCSQKNMP